MKLAVVSHKLCWTSQDSPTGCATDGGFPIQIEAISELFDETTVVVPLKTAVAEGTAPLKGRGMKVAALSLPKGSGLPRKLGFPLWLVRNGSTIWREVRRSDAVHAPIPGDVGTIGMLFALILRKPLFVRYCGNWLVQRTIAERIWKRSMELVGGGRNVMLATGGAVDAPSIRNKSIEWIFSTSMRRDQIAARQPRVLQDSGAIRMVTAARQEPRKGTDIVIRSMPSILRDFPNATLDVIGDGSCLPELRSLAAALRVETCVRFLGKLEHPRVLSALEQADLFCYPTSASEGFPKVVLEALASGLPVVTTPVSVLPELMKQGGGVLIDKAEPLRLAEAVINICRDKDRYEEMSRKAIETAMQYSLEEWQSRIAVSLRTAWGASSIRKEPDFE